MKDEITAPFIIRISEVSAHICETLRIFWTAPSESRCAATGGCLRARGMACLQAFCMDFEPQPTPVHRPANGKWAVLSHDWTLCTVESLCCLLSEAGKTLRKPKCRGEKMAQSAKQEKLDLYPQTHRKKLGMDVHSCHLRTGVGTQTGGSWELTDQWVRERLS